MLYMRYQANSKPITIINIHKMTKKYTAVNMYPKSVPVNSMVNLSESRLPLTLQNLQTQLMNRSDQEAKPALTPTPLESGHICRFIKRVRLPMVQRQLNIK